MMTSLQAGLVALLPYLSISYTLILVLLNPEGMNIQTCEGLDYY